MPKAAPPPKRRGGLPVKFLHGRVPCRAVRIHGRLFWLFAAAAVVIRAYVRAGDDDTRWAEVRTPR